MGTINRPAFKDRLSKALLGVDKVFTGVTSVTLNGKAYTVVSIKTTLQSAVDAANSTDDADAKRHDAVVAEHAAWADARALLSALEAWAKLTYGSAAAGPLAVLGFEPPKTTKVSVKTKAAAQEKSAATRAERHTMGKVQKKTVKAAATPPAPANATTTPKS